MSADLCVIVLAAGRGTRMKSALPKVLHPVAGLPMAAHVLREARELAPGRIIVVTGFEGAKVQDALRGPDIVFIEQAEQLGTGHAVKLCAEAARGFGEILVLNGDSPLVAAQTLRKMCEARGEAPMGMLTCTVADVGAFGRVKRNASGAVEAIMEQAGGTGATGIAERNAGQYSFAAAWLWNRVGKLSKSSSGEYYLTELAAVAVAEGTPPIAVDGPADELMGFDDRVGLAEAERLMRARILRDHMLAGVTIADPATTYIDATVRIAPDVTILQSCWLSGATEVETGTTIGPGSTLRNSRVEAGATVWQSTVEDSTICENAHLGPYAHVRGRSVIGPECHLGNYAEVNRSTLGRGVKMHHFSYLGDATVGDEANIAAGVITCNYDGVNKHPTVIGARAFVGCDTMLVAPVEMGEGAQTGAGTVLNRDLGPGMRAVGVPARVLGPRSGDHGTD